MVGLDPAQIKRAYLERNGSISVIPFEKQPAFGKIQGSDPAD